MIEVSPAISKSDLGGAMTILFFNAAAFGNARTVPEVMRVSTEMLDTQLRVLATIAEQTTAEQDKRMNAQALRALVISERNALPTMRLAARSIAIARANTAGAR